VLQLVRAWSASSSAFLSFSSQFAGSRQSISPSPGRIVTCAVWVIAFSLFYLDRGEFPGDSSGLPGRSGSI
jgi:hypothetical protein